MRILLSRNIDYFKEFEMLRQIMYFMEVFDVLGLIRFIFTIELIDDQLGINFFFEI